MAAKKMVRKLSGTKEWAEHTVNICTGCSHNCRYCYARQYAVKRFSRRESADWVREELTQKASMTKYPARKNPVMFPSTHDITPNILEDCVRVLRVILAAGNEVLIVTKPHLAVVERLVKEFVKPDRRDMIEFRFTIGTLSPTLSKFWEPGAPLPSERIAALKVAYEAGYKTSVSMEPMLGGFDTVSEVMAAVQEYVTETVWIGKMHRISAVVDMDLRENQIMVAALKSKQTDTEILKIYQMFKDNPMVKWKNTVVKVLTKYC